MPDTQIRIEIDIERMTFDDMIELVENEELPDARMSVKMRNMKSILAKFVIGEDGEPMEREAALATLGALPMSQVKSTFEEFKRVMSDGTGGVLPNG